MPECSEIIQSGSFLLARWDDYRKSDWTELIDSPGLFL